MSTVDNNDILTIAFTGKIDDGTVFIEITPEEPMKVRVGQSELPPTLDTAIVGMEQGETRKIRVPPDEGYGARMKDLLHEVPRTTFEGRINPKPGMILSQKVDKDGVEETVPATVIEIKDETVVIDYNHPLAGHHLTYDLTILKIEKSD